MLYVHSAQHSSITSCHLEQPTMSSLTASGGLPEYDASSLNYLIPLCLKKRYFCDFILDGMEWVRRFAHLLLAGFVFLPVGGAGRLSRQPRQALSSTLEMNRIRLFCGTPSHKPPTAQSHHQDSPLIRGWCLCPSGLTAAFSQFIF